MLAALGGVADLANGERGGPLVAETLVAGSLGVLVVLLTYLVK